MPAASSSGRFGQLFPADGRNLTEHQQLLAAPVRPVGHELALSWPRSPLALVTCGIGRFIQSEDADVSAHLWFVDRTKTINDSVLNYRGIGKMSSRQVSSRARVAGLGAVRPSDQHLLGLGKLAFLAGFCPLHRRFPGHALSALFFPAINNNAVRFFEDEFGATAAALIWARLSDKVSERMLIDRIPPTSDEWTAGEKLWFLDLIAPFGHGRQVARLIAREPPAEPFYFARLGLHGGLRKVVEGDATRGRRGFVRAFQFDAAAT